MELADTMIRLSEALAPAHAALVDALRRCETRSDLLRWVADELALDPVALTSCESVLRDSGLLPAGFMSLGVSMPARVLRDDLLAYLSDSGIRVTTDWQRAVDLLEAQGVHPIADAHKGVCGLVHDGTIYINPAIADLSTPIHEYTHLWAEAMRLGNPSEWAHIVELFKTSSQWDEAVRRYAYLRSDDAIAEELLATYSGREGAALLQELERGVGEGAGSERFSLLSCLACIRQALAHFWKEVADFLHLHYTEPAEVASQVLRDFLMGHNPLEERQPQTERLPNDLVGVRCQLEEAVSEELEYTSEMREIIRRAEANGTLGLAPNGARSNLDQRQWAMVRTEAFKQWFGDWERHPEVASQVVDLNGEPLVVYHGTQQGGFSVFTNDRASRHSLSPTGAIWFSNDLERARSYSGNRKEVSDFSEDLEVPGNYSCFLNIRRMVISDFDGADWEGIGHELYELQVEDEQGQYIETVTNSEGLDYFKSGEEAEAEAERLGLEYYTIRNNHWLGTSANSEAAMVLEHDYGDGLLIANVIDNGQFGDDLVADDYVVFSPYQIKSATCNIGRFDPREADIRYQLVEQTASLASGGVRTALLQEIHQALVAERDLMERSWLEQMGSLLRKGCSDSLAADTADFVQSYCEVCRLINRTEQLSVESRFLQHKTEGRGLKR